MRRLRRRECPALESSPLSFHSDRDRPRLHFRVRGYPPTNLYTLNERVPSLVYMAAIERSKSRTPVEIDTSFRILYQKREITCTNKITL